MILEQLEFWHWWIAGLALISLEIFAPGFILMWFGVAAAIVGLLVLLFPGLPWEAQAIIFALFSVSSIVLWKLYGKPKQIESDHPNLNKRGMQYVGQRFTLEQDIKNGTGTLRVADTRWKIRGDDLPAGTDIKVTGVEGNVLVVEPVQET